jgi:GT2 family glycosyltransferase
MRILFVCVNYRSELQTLNFVQSCFNVKDGSVYVVVVDNSAKESQSLPSYSPATRQSYLYDAAEGNLGYLNALGRGVRAGLEHWGGFEWAVLCNVDLTFDIAELKGALVRHSSDHSVGVIGPTIISSATGRNQNPFLARRPPRFKVRLWRLLYRYPVVGAFYQVLSDLWSRHSIIRKNANEPRRAHHPMPVYAVHGSFFAVSQTFLSAVGRISWPCFLFGEELWFAEAARNLNLRVLHDPSVGVQHIEHGVTSQLGNFRKMRWHYESMNWLFNQYWAML